MALGKTGGGTSGYKVYILKPVSKDKEGKPCEAHFSVTENVDNKWVVTGQETAVTGDLYKVEVKANSFSKDGREIKFDSVTLGLVDEDKKEKYIVDLRFNLPSRTLFNMVANLKRFNNLKLSYYTGNNGYDRFSLRQDDVFVEWKYKIEELPKPLEVTFRGEIQRDFSPVDDLFKKELAAIAGKLSGGPRQSAPASNESSAPKSNPAPTTKAPDEDVPF